MKGSNLEVHHMDGRAFLSGTQKRYDLIIVDAYKQPYIPFHLTTAEFFEEVNLHLNDGGIVAINVASVSPDSKVLKMLKNTMAVVYKKVYVMHPSDTLNYIVIASNKELSFDVGTDEPELKRISIDAMRDLKQVEFDESILVLTDDKAPVEILTDVMIFEYILKGEATSYSRLFE